MEKKLNVGLIGAGRIGRVHAAHLAHHIPEARLTMVADVNRVAAQGCVEQGYAEEAVEAYQHVLDDPAIEAVVVCSATDTHAEIIEAAAAAGKHIFCEKPIDLDLTRIDRALEAVEKAGVVFQVGFNRRFDASYRRVREAVVRGEVGEPHLLHLVSRDPAPPPLGYVKASGGLFLDMTIHDFDMARFLIGSEVVEVYTTGGVRVDPAIGAAGDLDTAVVVLTFENGTIGTIDNSRQAVYGYDQRVEVFGSSGSIRIDNAYPNSAVVSTAQHIRRDRPLNFFMDRYVESYVAEMQAFVDAVLQGTPPPVTGRDGRAPVAIGLAARLSYDEHRPVQVCEVETRTP